MDKYKDFKIGTQKDRKNIWEDAKRRFEENNGEKPILSNDADADCVGEIYLALCKFHKICAW